MKKLKTEEYLEILETFLDQTNKIKQLNDIIRNIRNLSENEKEENYYGPVRVSNFWGKNYIEYESNGDRNKSIS